MATHPAIPHHDNEHAKTIPQTDDGGAIEKGEASTFKKSAFFSRARILGPVEKDHGDLALLACCFVTGMVDAAVFSNWGE